MPSRLQIDDGAGIPKVGLATSARPHDNFIRPSAPQSQSAVLLQSLGRLEPSLNNFAQALTTRDAQHDEEDAKKQITAGAAQARKTLSDLDASRTTYAKAYKEGRIRGPDNPWMKQGYDEEIGRMYAGRLQSDLTAAMESDEGLADSVSVADYRKYAADFEKSWMEDNIPEGTRNGAFETGYGARRDAILQNMENGWAAQTEERFTKRSLAMFKDEAIGFMQEAFDKDATPAEVGATLRQMWTDKHAIGWSSQLTRGAIIEAVANVALERKDPEMLEAVLKSIPDGDGKGKKSLYDSTLSYDLKEKVDVSISQARQRKRAEDEQVRGDMSIKIDGAAALLVADAHTNNMTIDAFTTQMRTLTDQALANHDPQLAYRFDSISEAYKNDDYKDDKDQVAGFLQKLYKGPYELKQKELDVALRAKQLSLQTYNSISSNLQEAQRRAKQEAGEGNSQSDPLRSFTFSVLQSAFTSTLDAETPVVRQRRLLAEREAEVWYHDNFKAPGAKGATLSKTEQLLMIRDYVSAEAAARLPNGFDSNESMDAVFKLQPDQRDWKKYPVDTPRRLANALQEIRMYLNNGPTPGAYTTSLLRIYDLAPQPGMTRETYNKLLGDFVGAQNHFTQSEGGPRASSIKPRK